jgi:hypothetical protein
MTISTANPGGHIPLGKLPKFEDAPEVEETEQTYPLVGQHDLEVLKRVDQSGFDRSHRCFEPTNRLEEETGF